MEEKALLPGELCEGAVSREIAVSRIAYDRQVPVRALHAQLMAASGFGF
jgi:hypothetical protein